MGAGWDRPGGDREPERVRVRMRAHRGTASVRRGGPALAVGLALMACATVATRDDDGPGEARSSSSPRSLVVRERGELVPLLAPAAPPVATYGAADTVLEPLHAAW